MFRPIETPHDLPPAGTAERATLRERLRLAFSHVGVQRIYLKQLIEQIVVDQGEITIDIKADGVIELMARGDATEAAVAAADKTFSAEVLADVGVGVENPATSAVGSRHDHTNLDSQLKNQNTKNRFVGFLSQQIRQVSAIANQEVRNALHLASSG